MRYPLLLTIVFLSLLFSNCGSEPAILEPAANATTTEPTASPAADQPEIQALVRKYLAWANSDSVIELLPIRTDSRDSLVIGVDLAKHQQNLEKLEATGFFDVEFLEDYNRIIVTLDKNFKEGKYKNWLAGELPPFEFASDVNPWTLNQDVPYDTPRPWEQVVVDELKSNGKIAEGVWKWGKLPANADPAWKSFTYKFRAIKYDGKWKIAYLRGFNM